MVLFNSITSTVFNVQVEVILKIKSKRMGGIKESERNDRISSFKLQVRRANNHILASRAGYCLRKERVVFGAKRIPSS